MTQDTDIGAELDSARRIALCGCPEHFDAHHVQLTQRAARFASDWMLSYAHIDISLVHTRGLAFIRARI